MPPKRLYRSNTNRVFFGVCGGIGEYFNIDPVLVRAAFVLSALFAGWGFLFYIILIFIVPENPAS